MRVPCPVQQHGVRQSDGFLETRLDIQRASRLGISCMPGTENRASGTPAQKHRRSPDSPIRERVPVRRSAGPLNPPRPLRTDPLPRPTIVGPGCRRGCRCRAQVLWPAAQWSRSSWPSPRSLRCRFRSRRRPPWSATPGGPQILTLPAVPATVRRPSPPGRTRAATPSQASNSSPGISMGTMPLSPCARST